MFHNESINSPLPGILNRLRIYRLGRGDGGVSVVVILTRPWRLKVIIRQ